MSFFFFDNIEIAGVAAAVPEKTVEVDSFIPTFGEETVRRFEEKVGVQRFHRAAEGQTASDLGFAAANELFDKLAFDREKIGLLTFVSLSQDYLRPATACVLQYRLGLPNSCTAFDIGMGCSGFVYGLQITSSMMQNSDTEWALMLCCETANQLMYPQDQSTAMLVGDAGAAVLLHKCGDHSIRGLLGTDGAHYRAAIVPAGGFRHREVSRDAFTTEDGVCRTNYHYLMDGVDIFTYSMSNIPKAIQEFLSLTGTAVEDYDSLLLHQANKMIVSRLVRKLEPNAVDVPISLDRYGNTSSVAIPLTLCDAYAGNGGVRRVLACGFGTGLSFGVTAFEVDSSVVFPIIETAEVFDDGLIH